MKLPPLYDGKIISRYKRFLADIECPDKTVVTAHCPNTGSMTGCWEPGAPIQMSASTNPKRKLKWTLERVDMGQGWVGVNTSMVNKIISDFLENQKIPTLSDYTDIRSEPAYNVPGHPRSRFDFCIGAEGATKCYVEVKNTTLFNNDRVTFPDAVTTRGKKHLQLLQHAVAEGHRGVILFAVNRPEGSKFSIAKEIDPAYYQEFIRSLEAGVEAIPLRLVHTERSVEAGEILPLDL